MIKIKKLETRADVYDINVKDNHNFYANNILVHNCVESFSFSKPATEWKTEVNLDEYITTESSGFVHSCNLTSINVANILNNDKLLKRSCFAAVRLLDSSIDLGTMPIYEAKKSAEFIRNIGIGVVGMADYMAYNDYMYDTEEGKQAAETLFEKIAYFSYSASIELAKEKGAYPGIVHANYDKLFGKDPKVLNKMSITNGNNFDWVQIQKDILEFGIRNMLLLSPAPNTSTALGQGVTASYLPAHAKDSTQKLGDMIVPILPKFIATKFWSYKTKFQYKTEDLISFTRRCQRWVDTGMSMECPINSELTSIKAISDEILDGFKSKELKAVYYSLTIDGKKAGCEGCAN